VPGGTVSESEGDRTSLCERHGLTHTSVVRGDKNRTEGQGSGKVRRGAEAGSQYKKSSNARSVTDAKEGSGRRATG